jgi:Protein of unknown function (DUF4019)
MRNAMVAGAAAIAFFAGHAFAEMPKEKAASAAATSWLSLTDGGKYAESWQEASTSFKSAVKQEQWEQMAATVRKPLGAVVSRKLKAAKYQTALPGAPDGEYVIAQFEAAFANKASAVETVTLALDKDGKWRTAGYYIK